MKEVLTLMEVDDETGEIVPVSLELLETGRMLLREADGTLSAVMIGSNLQQQSYEIARYADKVYVIDHPSLKNFNCARASKA